MPTNSERQTTAKSRPVSVLQEDEEQTLLEDCRETLNEVDTDLLDLAQGRAEASPEFVGRVFRALHSVTGAAGYLGNDRLLQLCRLAESVLSEARNGKLLLGPRHANAVLAAADRMRDMAAHANTGQPVDSSVAAEGLRRILNERCAAGAHAPAAVEPAPGVNPLLRVLVVEDDFTSRVVLQGLLSKHGECHIAVNGREAVEAYRTARDEGHPYDLICMDIHMPEMDGKEAVERIRLMETAANIPVYRGVKIFMTTGIQDFKTVMASFKALCDAYLFKPVQGTKLEEHLRAFSLLGRERS